MYWFEVDTLLKSYSQHRFVSKTSNLLDHVRYSSLTALSIVSFSNPRLTLSGRQDSLFSCGNSVLVTIESGMILEM